MTRSSRSESSSWSPLPFVWQRWRQFRCAVRTFGLHELQLNSGCCRHCVIVAASGVLSAASIASAAPQEEQRVSLTSLSAAEGASLANAVSAIPRVAGFYTLAGDNGEDLRVSFVQKTNVLTATWTQPNGQVYGRGTYRWDPVTGSFKGTSTTRYECLRDEGPQSGSATIVVREELYVVNDYELRDRWTKPLAVDCAVGLMEIFKWVDHKWLATDKDWKPLRSPESPEILVGAR